MVDHALRDDDVGLGKCLFDGRVVDLTRIAAACDSGAAWYLQRNVVRKVDVKEGRLPGHRDFGIDDSWKHVVGHDDRVQRVPCDIAIARDDDRDRFSRIANGLDGDGAMRRRRPRGANGHGSQDLGDVCTSKDGLYALNRFRSADIDCDDTTVRHVTALEGEVLHADQRHIIDIGGAALNQPRIFPALDALAYELWQYGRRRHRVSSVLRRIGLR